MLTLYSHPESGNSYKARLLLSFLDIPHRVIDVDLMTDEQHQPAYLAINPRGEVPALTDGGLTLRDSAAILVYLAASYGPQPWYPPQARAMAEIAEWLAFAASWVQFGVFTARAGLIRDSRERTAGQFSGKPGRGLHPGTALSGNPRRALAPAALADRRAADNRGHRQFSLCGARSDGRHHALPLPGRRSLDRALQGAAALRGYRRTRRSALPPAALSRVDWRKMPPLRAAGTGHRSA